MPRHDWRRYAAPAAFLLAATIAVLLVRSGLHAHDSHTATTAGAPTTPIKRVSTTTTRTTTTKTRTTTTSTTTRFWTVQAGDTFLVISQKTGVPVADLQRLNPKVSSTSLFIGEKIRLR